MVIRELQPLRDGERVLSRGICFSEEAGVQCCVYSVFGETPGELSNLGCLGALQRGVGRARRLVGSALRSWIIACAVWAAAPMWWWSAGGGGCDGGCGVCGRVVVELGNVL